MVRQGSAIGMQHHTGQAVQGVEFVVGQLLDPQQMQAGDHGPCFGAAVGHMAVAHGCYFMVQCHQVGGRFRVHHHQVTGNIAPEP